MLRLVALCIYGHIDTSIDMVDETVRAVSIRRTEGNVSARVTGLCSGVLLSGQWVLTAKHCFDSAAGGSALNVGIRLGSTEEPVLWLPVGELIDHPDLDATLVKIAIMPPLTVPMVAIQSPRSWPQSINVAVGYGHIGKPARPLFHSWRVDSIRMGTDTFVGTGKSGGCLGDSGAPMFSAVHGRGYALSGILVSGPAACGGANTYLRADKLVRWVDQVLRPEQKVSRN